MLSCFNAAGQRVKLRCRKAEQCASFWLASKVKNLVYVSANQAIYQEVANQARVPFCCLAVITQYQVTLKSCIPAVHLVHVRAP